MHSLSGQHHDTGPCPLTTDFVMTPSVFFFLFHKKTQTTFLSFRKDQTVMHTMLALDVLHAGLIRDLKLKNIQSKAETLLCVEAGWDLYIAMAFAADPFASNSQHLLLLACG